MRRLYPWKEWFEKGKLLLIKGKDFKCSPVSFASQLRNAAAKLKLHVSIAVTPKGDFNVTVKDSYHA